MDPSVPMDPSAPTDPCTPMDPSTTTDPSTPVDPILLRTPPPPYGAFRPCGPLLHPCGGRTLITLLLRSSTQGPYRHESPTVHPDCRYYVQIPPRPARPCEPSTESTVVSDCVGGFYWKSVKGTAVPVRSASRQCVTRIDGPLDEPGYRRKSTGTRNTGGSW